MTRDKIKEIGDFILASGAEKIILNTGETIYNVPLFVENAVNCAINNINKQYNSDFSETYKSKRSVE